MDFFHGREVYHPPDPAGFVEIVVQKSFQNFPKIKASDGGSLRKCPENTGLLAFFAGWAGLLLVV